MPKLNFCFEGYVNGAEVTEALDIVTGKPVDVSDLTSEELVDRLDKGDLAVSLDESLCNCDSNNVELHDYEAPI